MREARIRNHKIETPAQHFPGTLPAAIATRADALLSVDARTTSVTRGDIFALWQAACALEGFDPNVLTHTFSTENMYAIKAKELKPYVTGSSF